MKRNIVFIAVAASFALSAVAQTPEAVTPKGVKAAMTLTGSGPLGYECKNTDGKFAWAGPVPNAKLTDKSGKEVGKYVAGQGGYGIQSAAGASELAASLLCGAPMPAELARHGVNLRALAPQRLR